MRTLALSSALLLAVACASGGARGPSASATLEPRGDSKARGTARFTTTPGGGLLVALDVTGAREGLHGVHLHAAGDCAAPDDPRGGDFDPAGAPHAGPGALAHHAGDLGNMMVTSDGRGHYEWVAKGLTVAPGPLSVTGRTLVLHAMPDDLATQPEGNAGPVVACGAVR